MFDTILNYLDLRFESKMYGNHHFLGFFLANLLPELDEIEHAAMTCSFVEVHTSLIYTTDVKGREP